MSNAPIADSQSGGGNWVEIANWFRYAYYLRFSILLWFFPIILSFLNSPQASRSLLSGIVAPITLSQYLCVAFFMVCAGFVALIQAHVVIINGEERFGEKPPKLLKTLFDNPDGKWEWFAPVAAQMSNLYFFGYLYINGQVEGVDWRLVVFGVLLGIGLALLFWYILTAIYYLIYQNEPESGSQGAKTLVIPRSALGLSAGHFGETLELAHVDSLLYRVSKFFPVAGYRYTKRVQDPSSHKVVTEKLNLYEGQFFSLIAAAGFYAVYWVMWPVTAPIAVPDRAWLALALFLLLAIYLCKLISSATLQSAAGDTNATSGKTKLLVWKIVLITSILAFSASIPIMYCKFDTERFPILASIVILVISMTWTLGGIAFFADRFRIPVLTTFVIAFILPRVPLPWVGVLAGEGEEHHISYISAPALGTSELPTPGDVLDEHLKRDYCKDPQKCDALPAGTTPTLIVVTSTGGGIHAAAWTAAVLAQLESRFSNKFHEKVLLLSTVSGGSVGLFDYLREIDPNTNGGQPQWNRMLDASRCSSLESVGWGLVYWDMQKATVPFFPYLFSPSSGKDDLIQKPFGKDRTWALRRAMVRNLDDDFCRRWAYHSVDSNNRPVPAVVDGKSLSLHDLVADEKADNNNILSLTLTKLKAACGSDHSCSAEQDALFPAFTMNTTSVEGGNRILLSNYRIQGTQPYGTLAAQPANSFLGLYGSQDRNANVPVDLPLATAAQMSATFPLVSSAASLDPAKPPYRVHFVDGGYYDNDGTISAIEFLRSALDQSKLLNDQKGQPMKDAKGDPIKLRILLVEIRNSADGSLYDASEQPQGYIPQMIGAQDQNKPWNALSQLIAPANAFWSAGHESITARNRNALGVLEKAYDGRLDLQHFVIDDRSTLGPPYQCVPTDSKVPNDPLNWYLTPCQQVEIDQTANTPENQQKFDAVKTCSAGPDPACHSDDAEEK
jgi:hypothetical protein